MRGTFQGTKQTDAVTLARVPGLIALFVTFWFLQVWFHKYCSWICCDFFVLLLCYLLSFLFIKCLPDAGDWLEGQIWRCIFPPQSAARLGNVVLGNGITEGFWHAVSAGDPEYEMRKRRGMWKRNLADIIFTYTLPFGLFLRPSSAPSFSGLIEQDVSRLRVLGNVRSQTVELLYRLCINFLWEKWKGIEREKKMVRKSRKEDHCILRALGFIFWLYATILRFGERLFQYFWKMSLLFTKSPFIDLKYSTNVKYYCNL